ncbi:MAG: Rieske (2Fe-2S) protein [Acidobacteria bacterium]|nr:Rieske (2Fe-2S) protein [Acidobacteriota bacterium]MCW5949384.1 Rieske (2Fe-2S) protein [Pyrinomonadaceae bacterium]
MNSKAFDQEVVNKILAADSEVSDESNVRTATAPYQAEFPYERDSEAQVTRREFCNFLFLTSSALFVGAAGFAGKAAYDARTPAKFTPAKIDGAMSIEPGSALNFSYPAAEDTAILVRGTDGNYAAFGQKCTHLSCPVFYSRENDRLECPCHNGGFSSKTGEVLYGPPPRPLDKIELETINGEIFAVKREVRGHEG